MTDAIMGDVKVGDWQVDAFRSFMREQLQEIIRLEFRNDWKRNCGQMQGLQPGLDADGCFVVDPGQSDKAKSALVEAAVDDQASGADNEAVQAIPRPADLKLAKTKTTKDSQLHEHLNSTATSSLRAARRKRSMMLALEHSSMASTLYKRFSKVFDWYLELEPPERTSCVARFVQSGVFEGLCAIVIFLNAISMVYMTNHEISHIGDDPTSFMVGAELGFLAFYTLELILKMWVHGLYFFLNADWKWNIFDLLLVLFALFDTVISQTSQNAGLANMTFLRTLRILKISKILRVFRLIRLVKDLRTIMLSIVGSAVPLFWAIVMMAIIFYMFSVVIVQGNVVYLEETSQTLESLYDQDSELGSSFGSVEAGMLSLYKATTGGDDWSRFYKPLSETGAMNTWMYLFFVAFTQIALVNILTGIFVEKAMQLILDATDQDSLALEHRKHELKQAEELMVLCMNLDKNHSGTFDFAEFTESLQDPKFRAYMEVMGLDIKEVESFFGLVGGNGTTEIRIIDFVNCCMKLKGVASCLDVHTLFFETRALRRKHDKMYEEMSAKIGLLADVIESRATDLIL